MFLNYLSRLDVLRGERLAMPAPGRVEVHKDVLEVPPLAHRLLVVLGVEHVDALVLLDLLGQRRRTEGGQEKQGA